MSAASLRESWLAARAQWAGNARLRAGLWLALGLVWVYGLLLLADHLQAQAVRAAAIHEDMARLRPLARSNPWPARAAESAQQVELLRARMASGADIGLAEAAVQDWTRTTAAAAGLKVRDLALTRGAGEAAGDVRLRLTVELGRSELMGFLSEVARRQPLLLVDRLVIRNPAGSGAQAEIELRAPLAAPAAAATAASGARR